jgi:hypothetical protein
LQPGDCVEVKSADEIAQTLDQAGRNRGLTMGYGLCRYSGGRYRVKTRLDRMILESTGEMRKLEGTVILEGLNCMCENVLGGCPREDPVFWREVWLKQVTSNDKSPGQTAERKE